MHYYHPRGVLDILPVDAFTARYPAEQVIHAGASQYHLGAAELPESLRIVVLEQSR